MNSFIDELSQSLRSEGSNANREKWAILILEKKIPLLDLIEIVHAERDVALRFMWLVGHICDKDPSVIYPAVAEFFRKRNDVNILNYNCSVAKMLFKAGVPVEIEAEVIDELFKWMLDPMTNVSNKIFAMRTLQNLSVKYPELKNELKIVIDDQLTKNKSSFDKTAKKVLESL